MAKSHVHRIVKSETVTVDEPAEGQTYRSLNYTVTAPPGFRVVEHSVHLAGDFSPASVAAVVDYGHYYQDADGDGVFDTVQHKVAVTATSAKEFNFHTIFERSNEPDIAIGG